MVIIRSVISTALGFAASNWAILGSIAAAFVGVWMVLHQLTSLSAENAAQRAIIATYKAAAEAQAVANDLEEKAAVDAALAETNNVRVLEGWYGQTIAEPVVANCVSGDTLVRLRKLQ